jgi:hypothetical protein
VRTKIVRETAKNARRYVIAFISSLRLKGLQLVGQIQKMRLSYNG